VGGFLEGVKTTVRDVQPPSDEECAFDVRTSVAQHRLVCHPSNDCRFNFQVRFLVVVLGRCWMD